MRVHERIAPRVYDMLAECPRSKYDLDRALDVSQVTVARALGVLARRGLARYDRAAGVYVAQVTSRPWRSVTLGELADYDVITAGQARMMVSELEGGDDD